MKFLRKQRKSFTHRRLRICLITIPTTLLANSSARGVMQPAMYDEMGNVNNVLEVQEYFPDNLDSLSGFQAPPSPPSSYNQLLPQPDDYATAGGSLA